MRLKNVFIKDGRNCDEKCPFLINVKEDDYYCCSLFEEELEDNEAIKCYQCHDITSAHEGQVIITMGRLFK